MRALAAFVLRLAAAAIPPPTSPRYPGHGVALIAGYWAEQQLLRAADAYEAP